MKYTEILLYLGIITSIIFLLQNLFVFLGFDSDTDTDADGDLDSHFAFFSFKNLVLFLAIFAWSNLSIISNGIGTLSAFFQGILYGILAVAGNILIMKFFSKFQTNVIQDYSDLIGSNCKVYLRVPPAGEGFGQIEIEHNGSIKYIKAVSDTVEYPTGSFGKIIKVENNLVILK